jgi:hypothetical protein
MLIKCCLALSILAALDGGAALAQNESLTASNNETVAVEAPDLDGEELWETDPFLWERWLIPSYLSAFDLGEDPPPNDDEQDPSSLPTFDFPVLVMNNPSRPDRRRHSEALLASLGFTNVSFPPGIPARAIDPAALIAAGRVLPAAAERIAASPYKGPAAVAPYLANAVAHAAAAAACAASAAPLCGVFEDDLFAPAGPAAARAAIAAALSELPPSADMLYLEARPL